MAEKESRRIEFDKDVIEFLKDYRSATGITMQQFVEDVVRERMRQIKLEVEFNDLKLKG